MINRLQEYNSIPIIMIGIEAGNDSKIECRLVKMIRNAAVKEQVYYTTMPKMECLSGLSPASWWCNVC